MEGDNDDEMQKSIRQCILSFFCAFDAETLPPPSTDPHVMQNIENPLYQKEINPSFLQQVEYIKTRIFNNCAPKKGFSGGSVISGSRKLNTLNSLFCARKPVCVQLYMYV